MEFGHNWRNNYTISLSEKDITMAYSDSVCQSFYIRYACECITL